MKAIELLQEAEALRQQQVKQEAVAKLAQVLTLKDRRQSDFEKWWDRISDMDIEELAKMDLHNTFC